LEKDSVKNAEKLTGTTFKNREIKVQSKRTNIPGVTRGRGRGRPRGRGRGYN
jgi:polyadenylate-binding protein 2